MQNIPDISQGRREIPPGKVLLCERVAPGEPRVKRIVMDERARCWEAATGRGVTVHLCAWTPGWACAGSMMRWDNGSYGVQWEAGGCTHGQRYKTLEEAIAHFNRIPA